MQYITDFHAAELNAASKMRSWGYLDAVATTGGADGGIDVSSSSVLAQVKWKGGAAGRPDLNRLFGARGNDTSKALFFFAASSYSKQAVEYADSVEMALFIYDPVGEVEPANQVARKFIQTNDGGVKVSFKWMNLLAWIQSSELAYLAAIAVLLIILVVALHMTGLI